MNKTKFSIDKAIKAVEISSRIEGHNPVKIDSINRMENSSLKKYRKSVNVVEKKTTSIPGRNGDNLDRK